MNSSSILSSTDNEAMMEKLRVFKIQGSDRRGHKILTIIGKRFPGRLVRGDALDNYLRRRILPELDGRPFSVLYVHSDARRSDNFPGMSTLRSVYGSMPSEARNRMQTLYFLHPTVCSRLLLATVGRLFFGERFYGKIRYTHRVAFLWEHVRRTEIELPDFVYDHDEALDYQHVMDYELESDHPRVQSRASLYSPVSMFSMRCIP